MSNKTCCILILTVFILTAAFAAQGAVIPRLQNGQSLKIAAIGTSLTDKDWFHDFRGGDGWFEQTGAWLQSQYPGKVTLSTGTVSTNRAVCAAASAYNAPAVGGYTLSNYPTLYVPYGTGVYEEYTPGTTQLNTVLANDNPDAIFIEFGMNDAYTVYNISAAQFKTNLQTMVNTIRTWGTSHSKTVDIVLLSMNDCYDGYHPSLPAYYDVVKQVATENASNYMLFIDNYPNWKHLHDTNYSQWLSDFTPAYGQTAPDSIHPTSAGVTSVTIPQVESSLLTPVLYGDANWDGTVNGTDLNTVLSNYNLTGMDWTRGDFNYDGTVNGTDLNTVLSNYNQSLGVGAAVPEPCTVVLLGMTAVSLLAHAWQRRRSGRAQRTSGHSA
jgi:hypothetical protein